ILTLNTHAETTKALEYSKPPYDQRLNDYPRAKSWYQMANDDSAAAYNIGLIYQDHIKDYKKAEVWYKKALELDSANSDASINLGNIYEDFKEYNKAIICYEKAAKLNSYLGLFNLALLYEAKLNNYTKAIEYYELADKKGDLKAANNLALVYKNKLKKSKKAIYWYEKAIKKEDTNALKNLGLLYHQQKDNINASQYYLAMIGNPYKKERIINFLKNRWKISEKDIKKGYELQLNSKIIPEKLKYKGGI
ncbi:tetratricopeptide repeat protein, partial [Sulfurimonas sp.]|uniref:tetratricopeptide repeat protein n=1 Tax=Sulfurimonas sp. TaxID=2022749 RepID=UPI003D0E98A0